MGSPCLNGKNALRPREKRIAGKRRPSSQLPRKSTILCSKFFLRIVFQINDIRAAEFQRVRIAAIDAEYAWGWHLYSQIHGKN